MTHPQPVFTPDNEPYLGRPALLQLDLRVSSCLKRNAITAVRTHELPLSDHQRMACVTIPQAVSIALSIRELIRQGYLFGAHVLVRPFMERVVILIYLLLFPDEIEKWNRGWRHREAPSLTRMLESIQAKFPEGGKVRGTDLTAMMNSLTHGRPDSAAWNIINMGDSRPGHASSKILSRPDLCDDVCNSVIPWLVITEAMMSAYFPERSVA